MSCSEQHCQRKRGTAVCPRFLPCWRLSAACFTRMARSLSGQKPGVLLPTTVLQVGEMGELLSNGLFPALRPHLYPLLRQGGELALCLMKTTVPSPKSQFKTHHIFLLTFPLSQGRANGTPDSLGTQSNHAFKKQRQQQTVSFLLKKTLFALKNV